MKKKVSGKASKKKVNSKEDSPQAAKKKIKKKITGDNTAHSILFKKNLTIGQKASDIMTLWVGSWGFIISLLLFMVVWMFLNISFFIKFRWDPFPFILLNFVLSTLAAIQAPIILMSQNRQAERDRISFLYDYKVNRAAEREVKAVKKELGSIRRMLQKK